MITLPGNVVEDTPEILFYGCVSIMHVIGVI